MAVFGMNSLGAMLHVGGSVGIVLGQTIVKKAHCIRETSNVSGSWAVPRLSAPQWRRPDGKWVPHAWGSHLHAFLGWLLFAAGNGARFAAMRFAAQTVLSGLGSLQFVLIPLVSRAVLGVRSDRSTALGVAVVLAGNALILRFGPGERSFDLSELRARWAAPGVRAFLLGLSGALCVAQMVWWEMRAAVRRRANVLAESQSESERAALLPSYAATQLAACPQLAPLSKLQLKRGGAEEVQMAELGPGSTAAQAGPLLPGALSSPRSRLAAEEARASAAMALDRAEGAGGDCEGDGGGAFQGSSALLDMPVPLTPLPPLPSHDLLLFSLEVSWLSDDGPYVFTSAALFSAVAALIGAWSVLFSKSLTYVLAELPDALGDWYTWFVVVAFFATAAFWVRQSDQGLRLYPAALIMPLMHAWWMCMSVLEGGIYFDELATLGTGSLVALLAGLFLALVGALFMGLAGFLAERQASPTSPPAPRDRKGARKLDAALSPATSTGPVAALSQDAERVEVRRRQL